MTVNDPAAHNEAQRRYFEQTHKPRMVPRDTPYLNRQVDEVLALTGLAPGDRVLEVGCGMGRYTLLLAARGIRVEGLDIAPALLERLQAFDAGRYRIPVHVADVANFPPGLEGCFSGVVGFFALHHVHDLRSCLSAAARLLAPGGHLAFLEPNPRNPLYYAQILLTPGMTWEGDRGILRMQRRLLFDAMEEAGLTEISVHRFGFFPPFLANRTAARPIERALEAVVPSGLLPFQIFSGVRP